MTDTNHRRNEMTDTNRTMIIVLTNPETGQSTTQSHFGNDETAAKEIRSWAGIGIVGRAVSYDEGVRLDLAAEAARVYAADTDIEFSFAYGSDMEIHKAKCNHLSNPAKAFFTNSIESITAPDWQTALRLAAIDWLETVDYEDGAYEDEDGVVNAEQKERAIADYMKSIRVFPCAKAATTGGTK